MQKSTDNSMNTFSIEDKSEPKEQNEEEEKIKTEKTDLGVELN